MNSETLAYRGRTRSRTLATCLCLAVALGAGCSRTVIEAPPQDQTEVVTESPGPDFVWVGGYWGWGWWGHYTWIGGHWERPDHPHGVWVRPYWEHRGDRYVMVEGHWR
jgi:hypothetical protein